MALLDDNLISDFKDQIRGEVVLPSDPSYDDVRQLWLATTTCFWPCAVVDIILPVMPFAMMA